MIFALKINKIPEFYMIFAKNARILHNNCPQKYFRQNVRGGGAGNVPPCPSSPTPTSGVLKKQKNKITVYVAFHPNIRIRIFV